MLLTSDDYDYEITRGDARARRAASTSDDAHFRRQAAQRSCRRVRSVPEVLAADEQVPRRTVRPACRRSEGRKVSKTARRSDAVEASASLHAAPRRVTVAGPNLPTTMPAARLARRAASRSEPPPARPSAIAAITVSPAPVTSDDLARLGAAGRTRRRGAEQPHAVLAARDQHALAAGALAEPLRRLRAPRPRCGSACSVTASAS